MSVRHLLAQISPSRYQIDLIIDPVNFTFGGSEIIEFNLMTAANELAFHAVGLEVKSAQ